MDLFVGRGGTFTIETSLGPHLPVLLPCIEILAHTLWETYSNHSHPFPQILSTQISPFSTNTGWPQIGAKDDFELLILLPSPPKCWGLQSCNAMPSFCSTMDWTPGFMQANPAPSPLRHAPSPALYGLFLFSMLHRWPLKGCSLWNLLVFLCLAESCSVLEVVLWMF